MIKLLTLPHSEVCMHMKVAGQIMLGELCEDDLMVQLYELNGQKFSFPITKGEAGWELEDAILIENVT